MNKQEVLETIKALMAAPSCYSELKEKAQAYLDDPKSNKDAFIAELKEDVTSIDGLIAFASSENGKRVFGDHAEAMVKSAKEAKAKGEVYCLCDACQAGGKLLAHLDAL